MLIKKAVFFESFLMLNGHRHEFKVYRRFSMFVQAFMFRFHLKNFYLDTPQFCKLALILLSGLLLQSCASYATHATSMRDGLLHGKPDLSLTIAEQEDPDQKEVISSLDKGMLRRINNDLSGSNQIFEVAKQEIEKLYGTSITENLAAVTINETLRGYEGDRYEQLLLHAYMAMNYIQLGQLDGARVEMLQANVKMKEWGMSLKRMLF